MPNRFGQHGGFGASLRRGVCPESRTGVSQVSTTLLVRIPLEEHSWAMDVKFEAALGGRSASGAGFGFRDLEWDFSSPEAASEALRIAQEVADVNAITATFDLS